MERRGQVEEQRHQALHSYININMLGHTLSFRICILQRVKLQIHSQFFSLISDFKKEFITFTRANLKMISLL